MFASACFYFRMNKYQCGQVWAGDQAGIYLRKGCQIGTQCVLSPYCLYSFAL